MRISDWSSDVCSSDLDHEGRSPAREVVARPDAAEQSVDKAKSRGRGGHERPRLREDDDQRILAQKGRFSAHIRAGDRSEEHTSELQSLMRISYAVFCLKKKTQ